jgi:Fur family ferric uptake transcriptional regulator|tara:strand:- start:563 stop:988 length:426 start_codon:yes stop_codon:yes gene_type:complete
MSKKAKDILSENNISVTLPRLIIIEELLIYRKPITVELLIRKVSNKVATSTLYRVLNDLKRNGILEEFSTPENDTVVELSLNEHDHHHHVFCTKCGEVEDVTLSKDIEKQLGAEISNIQKTSKYLIKEHTLELIGLCSNCN